MKRAFWSAAELGAAQACSMGYPIAAVCGVIVGAWYFVGIAVAGTAVGLYIWRANEWAITSDRRLVMNWRHPHETWLAWRYHRFIRPTKAQIAAVEALRAHLADPTRPDPRQIVRVRPSKEKP